MRPLLAALLIATLACSPAVGGAPINEESLLSSERFWPYQVTSNRDGAVGVLIRVEDGGIARIDFGRDGLRELRVFDTDLLDRANRIRNGEVEKTTPNFLLAIGPRLADPSGPAVGEFRLEAAADKPGFVCVFADPGAPSFAEIAKAFAPFAERHDATTFLFPQGEVSNVDMGERLRQLGWTVPFVWDHLSEPYTRTLLPLGLVPPAVMVVTNEGRLLLAAPWGDAVTPELTAALERL